MSSDDLPTFGRPRIATLIASSPAIGSVSPGTLEPRRSVEQIARAETVQGRRSASGSPRPRRATRARAYLLRRVVDLVRAHEHRLAWRCAGSRATSSSPAVTPARRIDQEDDTSASAMATRACSAIARVSGEESPMSTPPVSISRKCLPFQSQTSSFRSRVTPEVSCTTAARVLVSRLTSVDLPTFGKPMIATRPSELPALARRRCVPLVLTSHRSPPRRALICAAARSGRAAVPGPEPRPASSRDGISRARSRSSPRGSPCCWRAGRRSPSAGPRPA